MKVEVGVYVEWYGSIIVEAENEAKAIDAAREYDPLEIADSVNGDDTDVRYVIHQIIED